MKVPIQATLVCFGMSILLPVGAQNGEDSLREQFRADPLVVAFVEGFREKHGQCHWLERRDVAEGLRLMREVEPDQPGGPRGGYSAAPDYLVILRCDYDVSAEIHIHPHFHEPGSSLPYPFPLTPFFKEARIEYGSMNRAVGISEPVSRGAKAAILEDPLLLKVHALIETHFKNCMSLESAVSGLSLGIEPVEEESERYPDPWARYEGFKLRVNCGGNPRDVFQFFGRYFPQTGYIGWNAMDHGHIRAMDN